MMLAMMMAMMMTVPSFEEWDLLPCVEIKIASAVGSLDGTLESNHPGESPKIGSGLATAPQGEVEIGSSWRPSCVLVHLFKGNGGRLKIVVVTELETLGLVVELRLHI